MSTGNLRTEGGKGTNFPYQLAVLRLLEGIANGSLIVTGTFTAQSTQRAVVRTLDASGVPNTIPAGHKSVTIETSGDFAGTIQGVVATASNAYTFKVDLNNDTLGPISYNATSGSVIVTTIG